MQKKLINPIIAVTLALMMIVQCAFANDAYAYVESNQGYDYVRGNMYYTEMSQVAGDDYITKGIGVTYSTNIEKLLSVDTDKFDRNLALTADILATDVYSNAKVGTSGTAYTEKECTDRTSIYYNQFNMDSATVYDLSTMGYDDNDVAEFVIAHKKVTVDGKNKYYIVVAIRGTGNSQKQWLSNYDVGTYGNHSGFENTSQRVKSVVDSYIDNLKIGTREDTSILITGHSRGGAIANIIGSQYDTKFNNDSHPYRHSFTYTFASPAVTTSNNTAAPSVFNVINEDDAIPYFPISQWGFHRYGTDIKYNLANDSELWSLMTGIDYSACNGSRLNELVYAIAPTREDLYKFNDTPVYTRNFATEATAEAYLKNNKNKLMGLGFSEEYMKFEIVQDPSNSSRPYVLKMYICPAWLMQFLACLVSSDAPSSYYLSVYAYAPNFYKIQAYNDVMSYMLAAYGNNGLADGHCQYTYYMCALNSKELDSSCDHEFDEGVCLNIVNSCSDECYKMYTCKKCDGNKISDEKEQAGHLEESLAAEDSTWFNSGLTEGEECSSCDKTIVKQQSIAKLAPTVSASKFLKTIKVSWEKVTGATGYQVRYSRYSSMKKSKTLTIKGSNILSKKITAIKLFKKYYVQVRAYKVKNGKRIYSSWSKIVKL